MARLCENACRQRFAPPCNRSASPSLRATTRLPHGRWCKPVRYKCSRSNGTDRRMHLNSKLSCGASNPVHIMPLLPPEALVNNDWQTDPHRHTVALQCLTADTTPT